MNLAQHQLYIYNTVGELLTIILDGVFVGLTYGLRENEPGVLEFVLPGDFDRDLLMIDGQVEVYRAYGYGGMALEGQTAWFIRRIVFGTDASGVDTIQVTAYSAMDIMQRRIVAYVAGSSYSEKVSLPWDDMLREIVYENYGPGASYALASYGDDPDRNLEPWLITEPYLHYGASYHVTHSFPWRIVINVLQDIVNDVRTQGIYCSFDVIRTSPGHFEFRVFLGPRGVDHSSDSNSPVIVSDSRYNLVAPMLEYDWQGEHNFIYAGGQGQEDQRVVRTAQDDGRITISPFNRQEFNRDARQTELAESVQAEANSSLEEFRPRRVFTGAISQTEGCIYGVHWGWGDIVTVQYEGLSIDCHVESVTIGIDNSGTETVMGNLRSEGDV